jgi:integrase
MAGRGSIYSYRLKDGATRWAFTIDQDRIWDADARRWRRQQLKRSGYRRRLDCERALEAELPRIRDHSAPSLSDRQQSVGDFIDTWLETATSPRGDAWRPSTVATFRGAVENHIRPELGRYLLAELRPDDIKRMTTRMRGKGLSAKTIHQTYAVLRTALNQAIRERKITWNPCSAVAVAGPDRPPPEVWTPEETARFLARAAEQEPRLAVAYQVAAWRGLRRGEIAGLKWADLDLDAGTARVERNVVHADGRIHVGEPKTARGRRIVGLGPKLTAALREHRKRQAAERLAAPGWHDQGWVFPDEDGTVLPPYRLTQHFQAIARGLDLPPLHFHSLRHTAAAHMLLAGIAPKVVADQLGHSQVSMTLDTYAAVIPQQRDASAEAVEALYR